jgi:hypothetical protein
MSFFSIISYFLPTHELFAERSDEMTMSHLPGRVTMTARPFLQPLDRWRWIRRGMVPFMIKDDQEVKFVS